MDSLGILLVMVAISAIIAAAVAFLLGAVAPNRSLRKRTLVSAGLAGFIPVTIPLATIFLFQGMELTTLLAAGILVIGGGLLAIIVGFPVAHFTSKRGENRVDLDVFK